MPFAYQKAPALSEAEKHFQQELLHETELIKLRREYGVLQGERHRMEVTGFHKDSKGSRVFGIFQNEYENILTDLAVATEGGKLRADAVLFEILSDLLQEYDGYNYQVQHQKQYIFEVDGQIKKVQKNVVALQKQQITDRQYEIFIHGARQTLETQENKLELQMTTFNQIVAKNARLREVIDHFLWDRRNFMTIWKKLIDKLNNGKHIMLDLIEQASIAYDQREDWCNKLQLLRTTGHKDLTVNIDHMRAYRRQLDNANKIVDFFNIKGRKRVMKDLMEKEQMKRMDNEITLKQRLYHYNEMMNDIQKFTKQSETEVIATKYYQREASNFMNFKYINDMIKEMELIGDNLGLMHFDIEEQRRLQETRRKQQNQDLETLEKEVEEASQLTQDGEQDLEELNNALRSLRDGTGTLCRITRSDKDVLLQLLGDNSKIEDYNVLLYLQVLEKTISMALVRAGYKEKLMMDKKPGSRSKVFNDDKVNTQVYGIDKIVRKHPCALCMEHELVSDVIDVVQIPLNKNQVRENLKHRLKQPDALAVVHTMSKCHLPKSRSVMQERYA